MKHQALRFSRLHRARRMFLAFDKPLAGGLQLVYFNEIGDVWKARSNFAIAVEIHRKFRQLIRINSLLATFRLAKKRR